MTTTVLLCGERVRSEDGLGRADVHVVPHLCRHPEQIRAMAEGAQRLVLGLCRGGYSLGAVQREARRIGLDPLGVEILEFDGTVEKGRLEAMVAGARARAGAFRGSRPEQAKIVLPQQASRRALLTFTLPEYVAAPAIDAGRCAADRGCTACVDVCPQKALTVLKGRVLHDRSVCEPCGRCVTTCPTGAIENPAATVPQIEAQVRAFLDPGAGPPGPRGVVYRCRRGDQPEAVAGWYGVTVPCSAMVPAPWLLAPLLLGASGVALRPCTETGCPLAQDDEIRGTVAWTRDALVALGLPGDRVTTDPATVVLERPLPTADLSDPFGRLGGAAVLLALAEASASPAPLPAPAVPGTFGVVDIDARACTGCGTCTAACPTGALGNLDGRGQRSITFDANACVACGACAARCPERERGAIRMRPVVDVERLRQGRVVLFRSELATCSSCGAPVAPAAMLARLRELIGDDLVFQGISRLCLDCRGIAAPV